MMKKWVNLSLALALFSVFFLGCSALSKETEIKCPKCGGFFNTRAGEEEFRWMHGR